jgi:NAD(P)H-hydrate epimerase
VASLCKAGSGDLLTGLITSLLAQGYDNKSACIIALHLLNQSARLVEKKYTVFAASARLLVQSLPKAFKKLLP